MKQLKVLAATASETRKLERLIRKCKDSYYIKSENYTAGRDEFPEEFLEKYAKRIGRKRYIEVDDYLYDKLENLMKVYDPNNAVLKLIGPSSDKNLKRKVKLPYFLGSMDKIEPYSGTVSKWLKSHPGPYLVTDKGDGMSLLVERKKNQTKAFTRGRDGATGGDVSYLVPHLRMPEITRDMAIRGEAIISPDKYQKWKKHFKNERNMASGLFNRTDVHQAIKDVDILFFEMLSPRKKPSEGLAKLKQMGFKVVPNKVYPKLTEEMLVEILQTRKKKSKYEIDGLVIYQDKVNALNTGGNPDFAVAFKDENAQEATTAEVIGVEWEETRHGYLAPRIRIKPVRLRGVTVNYASGKNAGFIKKNRVGPGAVVRIRRAGDVIPDLKDGDVVTPGKPQWPDPRKFGEWEWTESGVNIKLKGKQSHKHNDTVVAKVIEHFFVTIGVEGFKQSTIEKYVAEGYRSVKDILAMSERRFTSIEGTTKTISKVYRDIQDAIDGVELPALMDASNIFGRGMGKTRLTAIIKQYPNIMKMGGKDVDELQEMVEEIDGFSTITARQFATNLGRFIKWLKSVPQITWEIPKKKRVLSDKLAGQRIIMTGFRDAELTEAIEKNGGQMVTTVRQATFLLVKDPGSTSAKTNQAKQLKIKIMTPDEFKRKYRL